MVHTEDESIIYADDYTKVFAYQSRQFTLGDLSLAKMNGIFWHAAVPAGIAAATAFIAVWLLLLLLGVSGWWALAAMLVPVLPVYVRMTRERGAGLTEMQKLHLWAHFRLRQPSHLLGLSANTESAEFTWDAILWRPTSRRWAGAAEC